MTFSRWHLVKNPFLVNHNLAENKTAALINIVTFQVEQTPYYLKAERATVTKRNNPKS